MVWLVPAEAKVVWQEDFEIREKLHEEWTQEYLKPGERRPTVAPGILLQSSVVRRSGKYGGRIHPNLLKGISCGVRIRCGLPANTGGVLTVWLHDSGEWYSGYTSVVEVMRHGNPVCSFGVAGGHQFYWFGTAAGGVHKTEFGRQVGWRRIQFLLDRERTGGRIRCYFDGRCVGETKRKHTSFGGLRLGSVVWASRRDLFYDDITLDDDPGAIDSDLFHGVDLRLSTNRVGNLFSDDEETVSIGMKLVNCSGNERLFTITGQIVDLENAGVAKSSPTHCRLEGGQEKEEAVVFPTPKSKGPFHARIALAEDGKPVLSQEIPIGVTFNSKEARSHADSPFGFHGRSYDIRNFPDVGFKWQRLYHHQIFSWAHQEPEKGKVNWERTDQQIQQIRAAGREIVYTLGDPPKWVQRDGKSRYPDPASPEFARYLRALVTRYKDQVKHWEVWNEVLYPGYGSPEEYCRALKTACTAIKATDPEARIVGMCGCPGGQSQEEFMERVFKAGGFDYFDILAYHFYPRSRPDGDYDIVGKIKSFQSVMAKWGAVKPIWDTEAGFYYAGLGEDNRPMSRGQVEREKALGRLDYYVFADADVANWTVREYVLMLANGVERFFHHAGEKMTHANGGSALFALAQAALAHELAGAEFVRRVDLGDVRRHAYLFRKRGDCLAIMWVVTGTATVELDVLREACAVMDLWGNETTTATKNGRIRVRLGERPVYLKGIHEQTEPCAGDLSLHLPRVVASAAFELELRIANQRETSQEGTLRVVLPEGWAVTPASVDVALAPAAAQTVRFQARTAPGVRKGEFSADASFTSADGTIVLKDQAKVYTMIPAPCARASNKIAVDGKFDDWGGVTDVLRMSERRQVKLGLPPDSDAQTLDAMVADGTRFWEGQDDLSAVIRTCWDSSFLYVAVSVTDNVLLNEHPAHPYCGDSVEIFLDARDPTGGQGAVAYADGVHHFRFAPRLGPGSPPRLVCYTTIDGVFTPLFVKGDGTEVQGRRIPDYAKHTRFESRTRPKGYTLEAAIPFSIFTGVEAKPGQVFGFDVTLNDQDYPEESRKTVMVWMGTRENNQDASGFGRMELVQAE